MIDQKKPDGYLAWHPEHGWEEYKHLRQKPDNPGLLNKLGDGWQIKPVWIQSEPPSGWISVKDRLPDKPGPYVVYRESIPEKQAFISYPVTARMYLGNGIWSSSARVTHWMIWETPPPDLEKENEK